MQAITRTLVVILAVTISLLGISLRSMAEDKPADNMQIVQEKIKADKKLFVAENMQLTETEAEAFWPVYESYQNDLGKLNDRLLELINDYAQNYETMTDQTAQDLTDRYLALESERVKLLQMYVPKVRTAVGSKKAARYMQLESKINAVVRYGLAANIPLVK